ncbi:MAG: dolichyl-phosphate beta-glucosyltransferase [Planctomycetota bacterium]|jgi:dolichyl-phosphate beta-glucosyltransferase
MLISFVIPVYNESRCLAENLVIVHDFVRSALEGNFEFVCVDDGSQDDSLEILRSFQDRMPLVIEKHDRNRGKGAAIRTGMLAAKGDPILFFDADLSTPLEEMHRFLPLFEKGAEVVIGTRKSLKAKITKFQPPHRVIMGMGYTYLVNFMLGMKVSDFTCGFKAFSRKATDAIFPRARIDGWSYDVEILYLAHRFGLNIMEVPVMWANKPGSKVRLIHDTIRSFKELLEIRRIHKKTDWSQEGAPSERHVRQGDTQ